MKNIILTFIILLVSSALYSQNGKQNVKGLIIDKQSEIPLIGASINLVSNTSLGSVFDVDGNFLIKDIPVGRQAFEVNYLGYEPIIIPLMVSREKVKDFKTWLDS